jgi:hypothetical protein
MIVAMATGSSKTSYEFLGIPGLFSDVVEFLRLVAVTQCAFLEESDRYNDSIKKSKMGNFLSTPSFPNPQSTVMIRARIFAPCPINIKSDHCSLFNKLFYMKK